MSDRPPENGYERSVRKQLVELVDKMLCGELSFLDGAVEVSRLKHEVGGVSDDDADFDVFVLIASETDRLPLKKFQHLWAAEALEKIHPDLERAEKWASGICQDECRNLLSRFRHDD
jgi:hypothetical protein